MIGARMDLHQFPVIGNKRRDDWDLERSGCSDDIHRFDRALWAFNAESRSANDPLDFLHLDPAADRGLDHLRVVEKIIGDALLWHKAVGIGAGKGHARKTIMPSWTICDQRVPPSGAPAFGDTAPFKHEVRHFALAQVFTHGESRLAPTHDQGIYFFRHHPHPYGLWTYAGRT